MVKTCLIKQIAYDSENITTQPITQNNRETFLELAFSIKKLNISIEKYFCKNKYDWMISINLLVYPIFYSHISETHKVLICCFCSNLDMAEPCQISICA